MQATTLEAAPSVERVSRDLRALLSYFQAQSTPIELLEVLAELDLSITQVKLMHALEDERQHCLKDLGAGTARSLPAISRAVDELVRRGLAERREDERDRRMKRVALTLAGRDVLRRLSDARLTANEQFVATLSERERQRLGAALAPLVAREEVGQ